jgi:formylglycine-generating enzyme required for sulfatase activity
MEDDVNRRLLIPCLALALFIFPGCDDDPADPAPTTGTIVINGTPDTLEFSWTLTQPDATTVNGSGDSTLVNSEAGDYTLAWNDAAGWITPAGETLTLGVNETVTFSGTYVELPIETGTIVIDPSPDSLDAPWSLSGLTNNLGHGDATLNEMVIGVYEINWGTIPLWTTPASETLTLTDDATLTFSGLYLEKPVPDDCVIVPAGTFTMGSPETEADRDPDEVQHSVTLTRDFLMRKTEVTQAEYQALIGSNPSGNAGCADCPVENVSWFDALAYCNAKSIADGLTPAYEGSGTDWTWTLSADGWRLPTEAEWEYACRAGTQTPFNTGDCLNADTEANYNGTAPSTGCATGISRGQTMSVGSLAANAWGLFDMHGNVWEWCWDGNADYPTEPVTDPASDGEKSIFRGGSWYHDSLYCRSANRAGANPDHFDVYFGFRLVRWADDAPGE